MNLYAARPPLTADDRTQLIGWLDLQRVLVRRKLEGLKPEDEHRSVFPTSPLMTPAGLVSHLRWNEHLWFHAVFLDEPGDNPGFQKEPESADWRADGVPLARLLDEFDTQWADSNEITAAHALDDVAKDSRFQPSLRWILIHMVEETARHVGQLDTMRELLDGETGYY
ncbi:DinB family protein [Kribbella jiaozuonensis]|uniref:DinB family protein n=1 Tax=Kribbella jiaozuonensis TaxID=2575441 RepID=A0A4U3LQF9_9ACTN|nr:DinB family protein [Kribbella jiaozuonensis]TKK77932.1 DinB family protein [Kribbella jiaozuonensis]